MHSLTCPEGYEGDFCQRCSNGLYGNPTYPGDSCNPCNCTSNGVRNANDHCHHETGKCGCKVNYEGRFCEKCAQGYGNRKEECPACVCSRLGSLSHICDRATGQCPCRHGVTGRFCDRCEEIHFRLWTGNGCSPCDCNSLGNEQKDLCDIQSGQCHCLHMLSVINVILVKLGGGTFSLGTDAKNVVAKKIFISTRIVI